MNYDTCPSYHIFRSIPCKVYIDAVKYLNDAHC